MSNQISKVFRENSATAKIICDSTHRGSRLTSIEVVFPRPYLAEFNTHTRLSRNSASSRAIPVWKRIASVLENPYIPNSFGVNKSGMQAGEELSESDQKNAVKNWLFGRDIAVVQAFFLAGGYDTLLKEIKNADIADSLFSVISGLIERYNLKNFLFQQDQGLHKQHANRVLETYSFHTVLVTATHWRNFFGLRASGKAQPEANDFGVVIARAMMNSTPSQLTSGEWHLPYITEEDRAEVTDQYVLAKASSGKSARTSYLTHDGKRSIDKDLSLAHDLESCGHMSPFQHPARPREDGDPDGSCGNYSKVWTQFRKLMKSEGDFTKLIPRDDLLLGCRGDEALVDFILSLPE